MSNPVKKERLEVPIWHKPYLTIDEATAYTGIGREKLREMTRFADGIKAEARYVTLDDLYELWKDLKRGLKNNTFENYKYIYETFVRRQIGSKRVSTFLKSDIKRFYNYLVDERGLKPATVDGVHNILHQIFDMAVDDNYIRNNPTNNVLRELKKAHCFKTEKRRGLTRPEQELFMDYLKNSNTAVYWYPVFAVMLALLLTTTQGRIPPCTPCGCVPKSTYTTSPLLKLLYTLLFFCIWLYLQL